MILYVHQFVRFVLMELKMVCGCSVEDGLASGEFVSCFCVLYDKISLIFQSTNLDNQTAVLIENLIS